MLSARDLFVSLNNGDSNDFNILRDISLDVPLAGITGILGESGSGKSMFAKTVCGLISKPVEMTGGTVSFNGRLAQKPADFEKIRGQGISMIFQHPTSALNPVFTVGEQLVETLLFHKKVPGKKAAFEAAADLLAQTGIPHPVERLRSYPHQLSGGMNQRVMIALGIATNPQLMIADEPTTALDVITQRQIINLLVKLSVKQSFGILFITHNMLLLERIADNILVFYAGELIEALSGADLKLGRIKHPCTLALKKCLPRLSTAGHKEPLYTIPGSIAKNTREYDSKCIFYNRCSHAQPRCANEKPRTENGVKCFYPLG